MHYLSKAIKLLKPEAEFSYTDNDYSTINWIVLDGDAPTQKEIDAAIKEVKANELAQAQAKAAQRQAILDRLGITAEEAQLLLS
jgi:acyl-CoA reductase-like NAD-dependent aldehyde dehydrogenase